MKINKKVVLITGAANGIGKSAALKFAANDYKLVLIDIDHEGLGELVAVLDLPENKILICPGNLEDLTFIASVVKRIEDRWGRIDVLINNAAWRTLETMRTISVEHWEKTLRICLTAPAFLSKWSAKLMEKNEQGGVILNVSSVMARRAGGTGVAYIACKGALESLTYELAALYGPKSVRVIAVAPGSISTNLSNDYTDPVGENISEQLINNMNEETSLQRQGTPAEVANLLYWLSTEDAAFITGTTIDIDGGFLHNFSKYSLKKKQFPDQF